MVAVDLQVPLVHRGVMGHGHAVADLPVLLLMDSVILCAELPHMAVVCLVEAEEKCAEMEHALVEKHAPVVLEIVEHVTHVEAEDIRLAWVGTAVKMMDFLYVRAVDAVPQDMLMSAMASAALVRVLLQIPQLLV